MFRLWPRLALVGDRKSGGGGDLGQWSGGFSVVGDGRGHRCRRAVDGMLRGHVEVAK